MEHEPNAGSCSPHVGRTPLVCSGPRLFVIGPLVRHEVAYSPSPSGGFAQKFKIESKVDRFRSLNVNKLASKPTFWAKPPPEEGRVRAKQSQGERLRFRDRHTLICKLL
jgi:hypothetical protein